MQLFPRANQFYGLGLSDPPLFSLHLAERLDYRNTWLHKEPRLDITALDPGAHNTYDFVIASEVFEHVRQPVQTAFDNLARLLKPGGFAIFSSPWESTGDSVEHFPELHDWRVVPLDSGHALVNRTMDGRIQAFDHLVFHGGPGSTLEMRVFSIEGLLAHCRTAGFEVTMARDNPEYGIVWEPWSKGMILRKTACAKSLLPAL